MRREKKARESERREKVMRNRVDFHVHIGVICLSWFGLGLSLKVGLKSK